MTEKQAFLLKDKEIAANQVSFSHPWNCNSMIIETQVSRLTGLKTITYYLFIYTCQAFCNFDHTVTTVCLTSF
jgi:hypothetical protein